MDNQEQTRILASLTDDELKQLRDHLFGKRDDDGVDLGKPKPKSANHVPGEGDNPKPPGSPARTTCASTSAICSTAQKPSTNNAYPNRRTTHAQRNHRPRRITIIRPVAKSHRRRHCPPRSPPRLTKPTVIASRQHHRRTHSPTAVLDALADRDHHSDKAVWTPPARPRTGQRASPVRRPGTSKRRPRGAVCPQPTPSSGVGHRSSHTPTLLADGRQSLRQARRPRGHRRPGVRRAAPRRRGKRSISFGMPRSPVSR